MAWHFNEQLAALHREKWLWVLFEVEQAHKLGKCDSYLPKLQLSGEYYSPIDPLHWLKGLGARRGYRI